MNNLITISEQTIGQEIVHTVNARELHKFLEVGKDFSTWLKKRIKEYNFLKNQDYIVLPQMGENFQGGRPSKDYALALDMAKELSMVERNEKGRQARRYFIECEKKLKSQAVDYELFSYECLKKPAGVGEILGLMMRRLLDANNLEEELEYYKALIKEAKQVLARSVVKAA
ncbi:antA/AntB antirepressor family protein [Bartonella vinsonii]|uniref:Anti-repressor protein n=1 Tax=Bartonella vinsonii subsp. berkhoffii str. Tweed TaxID=1094502 RepID=N6VSK4_BARVB|nr:antA/AntB antirepressor family protein [Bartonella vinsonii]ENN94017.1 anti-repressor protein [Bartonella vinsonii subsp. berkhoffii str. Tweed]